MAVVEGMGASPALLAELRGFRRVLETELGPATVFLFGSQATGRGGPESDLDILVVSRAFEGKSTLQRAMMVDPAWDLPLPVDFLCYTPEEFERLRRQTSIVSAALREGVEVEA